MSFGVAAGRIRLRTDSALRTPTSSVPAADLRPALPWPPGTPGKCAPSSRTSRPCWSCCHDAEQQRADTEDLIETFHRDGPAAAWFKFLSNAGFDMSDPEMGPPQQEIAASARFFDHELRGTTRHLPDVDALKKVRVVIGVGADSTPLLMYQTSAILACELGVDPVIFPGDHAGFLGDAAAFAATLRSVL